MPLQYGASGDIRELAGSPSEREVPATLLSSARTKATNLVDSYLEKAFPSKIPFTASGDVPYLINDITNDLSVFYLMRTKYPGQSPMRRELKTEFWQPAIDLLEKISKFELVLPELSADVTDDSIVGTRTDYEPIFDVDSIEGQVVDDDLIQDIEDAKD